MGRCITCLCSFSPRRSSKIKVFETHVFDIPTTQYDHPRSTTMPPSSSLASSAQIVRPGNTVEEYQKAYNASTSDHWFCLCWKKLSKLVRPSRSTFEQHGKPSHRHLRFMQENRTPQPQEHTLLTFFPAKQSSGNPSPQSTPTMPTATTTPMMEESVVPATLPLPPPPCPKVLSFGIKGANDLRRAYPLLCHGHEKAAWCVVDGLGLESVDPPCTGEGPYDSMGCIVPCSPCVRGKCRVASLDG